MMRWPPENYETELGLWLKEQCAELPHGGINALAERLGYLDSVEPGAKRDSRKLRARMNGKHWSIEDLCNIADEFDLTPAMLLHEIELRLCFK